MTRRMIAKLGQPVLLAKAEPVTDVGAAEIQDLVDDMIETLDESQGVGLAAPQVFESKRIILALDVESSADETPLYVLINPEIEALGDQVTYDIEGCLSIDHLVGIVPRHQRIQVRAIDRDGELIAFTAQDYLARVIQHEVDHLEGVLYPMRVRDWGALAGSGERRQLTELLEGGYERN